MATTRNIGQILIEKACELDSQYTPDRFNDAGEALDILLSHMGEATSSITSTIKFVSTNSTLTFTNINSILLDTFQVVLMRLTGSSTPEIAMTTFNMQWGTWDEETRLIALSDLFDSLRGSVAIPTVTIDIIDTYQIQYSTISNQTHLLYTYYDTAAKTNPIIDFCANATADNTLTLTIVW